MAKTTTPLTVSPSTMSMEIGGTATLVASSTGGIIVGATWSSSNKALAYVNRDTGLVTALVAGTATITATYRGAKGTSKVTVLAAPVSDLAITCPGDQTVTGTGALTVVKLGPIQTTGGVAPIVVTFNPPVGTGFPIGTTLVTATAVSADNQRATCQYSVTVTGSFPSPPAPLTVTCPLPVIAYTPDGNAMAVTFAATTTGGTAPITITYSPASGSTFAVGTTGVVATAVSTDGQTAICSFSVTVKDASASTLRGPQATITCPVGSVRIVVGASIQAAVDASPAGASFCIAAGTHTITAPITPKSGNTFVGEYGAILDGSSWVTSNEAYGAFAAYGGMLIKGVTIRNLVIQDMPQKGIHDRETCTGWTVENCEITGCRSGLVMSAGFTCRNNYLHHNGNGLTGQDVSNYAFPITRDYPLLTNLCENNEISYGGDQQKAINSAAITWRNNWFHHNDFAGLWNDGEGNGSIIEGNIVEDNGGPGIFVELSIGITIRNNTLRRNADQAIFVSTTRDSLVENNIMADNFRGVVLFLNCASLTQGWEWLPDLRNNTIRSNSTQVQLGAMAAMFSSTNCSGGDLTPYENNSKNNNFITNHYTVPGGAGSYWYWSSAGFQTFPNWQGLGKDTGGTVGSI